MLKLATVLCAGVFFGLTIAASSRIWDSRSTIRHIKLKARCIGTKVEAIKHLISIATSLSTGKDYSNLIKTPNDKTLYSNDNWIHSLLPIPLVNQTDSNNNASRCFQYVHEYQRDLESIEQRVAGNMTNAFDTMVEELFRGLDVCSNATGKLEELKREAHSCLQRDCYKIVHAVGSIWREVEERASHLECAHRKLVNSAREIMKKEYDSFYASKGTNALMNAEKCLRNGDHPSDNSSVNITSPS